MTSAHIGVDRYAERTRRGRITWRWGAKAVIGPEVLWQPGFASKAQAVAHTAQWLRERGIDPAVVSHI